MKNEDEWKDEWENDWWYGGSGWLMDFLMVKSDGWDMLKWWYVMMKCGWMKMKQST